MTYQDYDWQLRDAGALWRVAELYARVLIGGVWAIAMWIALSMLVEETWATWQVLAYAGILWYGLDLSLPSERCDGEQFTDTTDNSGVREGDR